ncbi:unnamed protein product [Pedinophyceae sp. YPF-701]|nr:unnamed protein product [Pedinophyceae sp. YPF-701]
MRHLSALAACANTAASTPAAAARRKLDAAPAWSALHFRGYASLPDHEVFGMPSLSPTMEQGNILEWKVKPGDEIKAGDILCEIETDKATMEWESQEDGVVAALLKEAGAKDVPVGEPVMIVVDEAGSVDAFKDYKPGDSGAEPAAAAAEEPAAPSGGDYPSHEVMTMPALSPTMSTGNILSWRKQEGDSIAPGDIFCEVETDKATIEWEAQEEGVLAKILVPEGTQDIEVGAPVMIMVDDADDVAAFKDYAPGAAAKAAPKAAEEPAPKAEAAPAPAAPKSSAAPKQAAAPAASAPGDKIMASPAAKRVAAERGVDLSTISGTGPGGRIVVADVEAAPAGGAGGAPAAAPAAPKPDVNYTGTAEGYPPFAEIPLSNVRRVIARRLLESKLEVPHYYVSMDCRTDALMEARAAINAALAASGGKVSVNDMIVKASACALAKVPEMNSAWAGESIRQYRDADISIAMQTPNGLMVPVVRGASHKGVAQLSADIKAYAQKAKAGKLTPEDSYGGTFTISNLGMFGVKQFSAIVNPPQAGILAVGGSRKELALSEDGNLEEVQVMTVTLSCDHRVVDGAAAAQWLQAFKGFIENPATMIV